ncbi:MAG: PAS domain-containing protein [Rhodospirillaceae bacterium]|jgi:hypothetical protein|nr:PAS domain-containing protein [Rhodospirillaceae bacterium]
MIDHFETQVFDFQKDDLPTGHMRSMFDYWLDQKGRAVAPNMLAIDPLKFPRGALPYLAIMGVERDPLRFFVRLYGTAYREHVGIDLTGHYTDEYPTLQTQIERATRCVEAHKPYIVSTLGKTTQRDYKRLFVLVLPFVDDLGEVAKLLHVVEFSSTSEDQEGLS